jgi:tRNA modification GTPase
VADGNEIVFADFFTSWQAVDELLFVADLQRLRELSVQSSNSSNNATDRSFLNTEASQLIDEVERIGIARAWDQITQADAVLFLHDLTRQHDALYIEADAQIASNLKTKLARHVPVLHLWNKADATGNALALGAKDNARDANHTVISAKTGVGLPALRQQLLQVVGWQGGSAEGMFMARERHVQALHAVDEHLMHANASLQAEVPALDLLAEELRLSQNALNTITGEFTSDDLLGVIFSSFCIGK